jgi:hypothetical protein
LASRFRTQSIIGALRTALRHLRQTDHNELLRVTALIVAASVLATQYAYLDRRDRGLWWGDGHYNLLRSYYILTTPRSEVFDEAGICRLGQLGPGCWCLLQAGYDPRRFLEYDVQPCLGYSPDQPNMIQHSRRSREQFEAAADDPSIAFFLGNTKRSVTIWDISGETYDKIIAIRTCIPLYGIVRVCYPRGA